MITAAPAPFHVVIPARYASQRLPGKPLLSLGGQPMIEHVYRRARDSGAGQVVVATDDQRIAEAVEAFGGEVCLTAETHQSGTDRIAEVVERYAWSDDTIIVNLQGDEPLMPARLLSQVASLLQQHADADLATLATPLTDTDQLFDPNVVKVVTDRGGFALYFSRATIPWKRDLFADADAVQPAWLDGIQRHLGIYAYRCGFLKSYPALDMAPPERMESLEQLRTLWYGNRIVVATALEVPPPGVDTTEDLRRIEPLFAD